MAELSLYHPIEFYCSVLRNTPASKDGKLLNSILAAKKRGILICPPDINVSLDNFEVFTGDDDEPYGIIAGFQNLKDVGEPSAKLLIDIRDYAGGEFESFKDFIDKMLQYKKDMELSKVPLNKTAINALILAGCFDCFEPNRYKLFKYYNTKINKLAKGKYELINGGEFLTRDKILYDYVYNEMNEDDYTRLVMIELEEKKLLAPMTEHPLSNVPQRFLIDIDEYEDGNPISFVGFIKEASKGTAKNKKKFANFTIELASSVQIYAKMWDCNAPSVASKLPRGLFSSKGDFDDSLKTLEELRVLKNTFEAKKKKGMLKAKDAPEYNKILKAFIIADTLVEGKEYTPYLFRGRVQIYENHPKSIILESITRKDSSIVNKVKTIVHRDVEPTLNTSVQIEDDI